MPRRLWGDETRGQVFSGRSVPMYESVFMFVKDVWIRRLTRVPCKKIGSSSHLPLL